MEKWIERNIPALMMALALILLVLIFEPIANAGREEFAYGGEYASLFLIPLLPWRGKE